MNETDVSREELDVQEGDEQHEDLLLFISSHAETLGSKRFSAPDTRSRWQRLPELAGEAQRPLRKIGSWSKSHSRVFKPKPFQKK